MSAREKPAAWSIEVEEVAFTYPGASRAALSGVSLAVAAGEHVAVVGPNGAGKSTLLLHLIGIFLPQHGKVRVGELEVCSANLEEIRSRVGIVFQDPDDQLFMPTLLEDVAFGPLCRGRAPEEAEDRARRALTEVGLGSLDPGRAAHHLSGGEKRRAAVATVLSMDPGVLALDEPTANLDGRGRRSIAEVLRDREQTLLVVTHDVEFAAAVCPRIVLMDGGRVVADLPRDELLARTDLLLEHGLELASWLRAGWPGGGAGT